LDIVVPVTIQKEQASKLGQKTKNIVEARVKKMQGLRDQFIYSFNLFALTLNYEYDLFSIEYGIEPYPVKIVAEAEIIKEFGREKLYNTTGSGKFFVEADSDKEFINYLRIILNSEKSKRVISAILTQAS